jgi:vacuolar-type H+-ATPase subunit E/Vma4
LLLAFIVMRRRRGDGGSPAVIVEPPPGKPPADPVVMRVWPQDIESPVTVRVRRAMAHRTPDETPLPFEGRRRARAAVASSASRWNTLGRQVLPRRRDSVSDGLQETAVSESVVPPAEGSAGGRDGKTAEGGRSDIGERINEILRAAEEAAKHVRVDAEHEAAGIRARAEADAKAHHETVLEQAKQVREEAEGYATETKQAVDSYATQKRREVEAEVGQLHREAETQARAIREAAEEMAKQLEAEARRKQQELDEGSRVIEVRLERLLGGIRETGSQLEALMGKDRGESLVNALSVERQRLSSGDRES